MLKYFSPIYSILNRIYVIIDTSSPLKEGSVGYRPTIHVVFTDNCSSTENQMQLTGCKLPIPVIMLNSSEHKTVRLANKQHITNICNTLFKSTMHTVSHKIYICHIYMETYRRSHSKTITLSGETIKLHSRCAFARADVTPA